jgi:hypothetical protein
MFFVAWLWLVEVEVDMTWVAEVVAEVMSSLNH